MKINWDALGISASLACAIHCALLPLFLTSLPIFGIEIIHNPFFEYGMIFLAFIVGGYSLHHGWKKHHHSALPAILFSIGMLCLLAKEMWHHGHSHILFLIPAVSLIVSAHYFNYRLCRKANHCHTSDCMHEKIMA